MEPNTKQLLDGRICRSAGGILYNHSNRVTTGVIAELMQPRPGLQCQVNISYVGHAINVMQLPTADTRENLQSCLMHGGEAGTYTRAGCMGSAAMAGREHWQVKSKQPS